MAHRPGVADLIAWLDITNDAVDGDGSPLDSVMSTALTSIEAAIDLSLLPEGDSLAVDSETYTPQVRTVVLLQAAKLYKRRTSPEGVANFGDLGVIRIQADDPDFALIDRYLKIEGFA